MRRLVIIGAVAAATAAVAGTIQAQGGPKSVWDGVYAEAQAERGKAAYADACATCHGPDLTGGGEAPALAGREFLSSWNGRSVGELFERTQTTMPLQAPGSLDAAAYTDILAYMFMASGLPAGPVELAPGREAQAGVRFDADKPGGDAREVPHEAKSP